MKTNNLAFIKTQAQLWADNIESIHDPKCKAIVDAVGPALVELGILVVDEKMYGDYSPAVDIKHPTTAALPKSLFDIAKDIYEQVI